MNDTEAFALVRATDAFSQPPAVRVIEEPGRLVHETRSYGNYWHGNVFDLERAPANDAALGLLLTEHRERFAWRSGPAPAIVKWCASADDAPLRSRYPVEETIALAATGERAGAAADGVVEIAPGDEAAWEEVARCTADDAPEAREYRRWSLAQQRAGVRSGAARWFAVRDAGRIVSTAGLYRHGGTVRYADVGTLAQARGRGFASTLVAGMLARAGPGVRVAVIVAQRDSQAERIYRRAGFAPIALRRCAVVPP